jgi:hypothetical protein
LFSAALAPSPKEITVATAAAAITRERRETPRLLSFILIVLYSPDTRLATAVLGTCGLMKVVFPVPDKCAHFAALQH